MPLLQLPEPYDFELSTDRFRAFGTDRANVWHDGGLHRVVSGREVRIEAADGGVLVTPADPALPLDWDGVEPVVRKLLGAELDLDGFSSFAAGGGEPLASVVAELAGYRPPLAPDPFEALVTSISAQQISLRAAFAVRSRLVERYGERGIHAHAFPTPERLACAGAEELTGLGFSRGKADAILELARSPAELYELHAFPDGEVKARLCARRGLGEWTADWFLARHLARPSAWPAGDLGLRKAVSAFYGGGRQLSIPEVRAVGDRFGRFANLSAHYLLLGYYRAAAAV